MLSASVTHLTAIITCARCYSNMDCITKVALKKSLDMFKIPFWSSTVEKGNQAHKGPQSAAVVMSIP